MAKDRLEGYKGKEEISQDSQVEAKASEKVVTNDETEVIISREEISQKFGMMIDVEPLEDGGHRISDIREGGIVDLWNKQNDTLALRVNDVLMSVNGMSTFEGMMEQFKHQLSCQLKRRRRPAPQPPAEGLKEDDSEAKKEAAEWERRRARVTAALVPGLRLTWFLDVFSPVFLRLPLVFGCHIIFHFGEIHLLQRSIFWGGLVFFLSTYVLWTVFSALRVCLFQQRKRKKIIDSEFGSGAGERLGRIEKMYHRVAWFCESGDFVFSLCLTLKSPSGKYVFFLFKRRFRFLKQVQGWKQ